MLCHTTQAAALELIVVRHGQTEWNLKGYVQGHSDVPLDETGREQAGALGQQFENLQFDAAYSSDLSRAFQTAELIIGDRDLAVTGDVRLRECNCGDFEGVLFDDVRSLIEEAIFNQEMADSFGMETVYQMLDRTESYFSEIAMRHFEEERVLVVSHGGIIRLLLKHIPYVGTDGPAPVRLENCEFLRINIDDTAITTIEEIGSWK
jgi:broad specificity phosphatase PhoE